ncbi:MAG: type II toxin-antitoxin system VapC family toxin [Thermodesulfovibrionia bacterium]|nr:type II toxin-antitoxin system VapC family toxin [Thermodesulfovibrionia bacterium]
MKFWDASAVIPLCIEEPQTKIVQDIAKKDNALVVWWGSLVECYSAFARLYREGSLKYQEEEQVREVLFSLASVWTEIEPSEDIRDIAVRLLLNHSFKGC